ncbi:MAG: hypothetical protein ACTSYO_01440 [Candidatus Ranarchaeia archaeon]
MIRKRIGLIVGISIILSVALAVYVAPPSLFPYIQENEYTIIVYMDNGATTSITMSQLRTLQNASFVDADGNTQEGPYLADVIGNFTHATMVENVTLIGRTTEQITITWNDVANKSNYILLDYNFRGMTKLCAAPYYLSKSERVKDINTIYLVSQAYFYIVVDNGSRIFVNKTQVNALGNYSFVDCKGKTQEGPRVIDVFNKILNITTAKSLTVYSSTSNYTIAWSSLTNTSNMVLFDYTNQGTLKFCAVETVIPRDQWVKHVTWIHVVTG